MTYANSNFPLESLTLRHSRFQTETSQEPPQPSLIQLSLSFLREHCFIKSSLCLSDCCAAWFASTVCNAYTTAVFMSLTSCRTLWSSWTSCCRTFLGFPGSFPFEGFAGIAELLVGEDFSARGSYFLLLDVIVDCPTWWLSDSWSFTSLITWCESTLLRRFAQRGPLSSFEGFNANLGVFEKFGFWRVVFSIDHTLCKTLVHLFTFFFWKMHSLSSERQTSCVPLGLGNFCCGEKLCSVRTHPLFRFGHLELNFERNRD